MNVVTAVYLFVVVLGVGKEPQPTVQAWRFETIEKCQLAAAAVHTAYDNDSRIRGVRTACLKAEFPKVPGDRS